MRDVDDIFFSSRAEFGDGIVNVRHNVSAFMVGLVLLAGCNDSKTDVSETRLKSMAGGQSKYVVPIKGVVTIDGSPAIGVNLFLYRAGDTLTPFTECRTDEDGQYCWSTNLSCDGLEPGKYLLGFTHIPSPKKNGTGIDSLKGKYKDPVKNKMELKVEEGNPDEVNYDLVTKS